MKAIQKTEQEDQMSEQVTQMAQQANQMSIEPDGVVGDTNGWGT